MKKYPLFPQQVLLPKNMAIFQLCICFVFSSTENFQQLLLFLILIHFQIYCCYYILNQMKGFVQVFMFFRSFCMKQKINNMTLVSMFKRRNNSLLSGNNQHEANLITLLI